MAIVAGVLAVVLVAGCGLVVGMGGVGDLVARSSPAAKLGLFGIVLVLVAATAWTLGSAVGPGRRGAGDQLSATWSRARSSAASSTQRIRAGEKP